MEKVRPSSDVSFSVCAITSANTSKSCKTSTITSSDTNARTISNISNSSSSSSHSFDIVIELLGTQWNSLVKRSQRLARKLPIQ